MEAKTQKQWLEEALAKTLAEDGPDSPLAKDLKAQIASIGTVRHPSQLAALNSANYHGGILNKPASAPTGDMNSPEVAGSIQDAVDKAIRGWDESTSPAQN